MSVVDPYSAPQAWDTLSIEGLTLTCSFEWSGDAIKRKLDRRHAPGRDGARIRDKGYDLAKIKLSLTLYEAQHFTELADLVALLFPRGGPTNRRAAVRCGYPTLAIAGITQLYPESMGMLKQETAGTGKWTVEIDFTEFRPAANAPRAHVVRSAPSTPSVPVNAAIAAATTAAPSASFQPSAQSSFASYQPPGAPPPPPSLTSTDPDASDDSP